MNPENIFAQNEAAIRAKVITIKETQIIDPETSWSVVADQQDADYKALLSYINDTDTDTILHDLELLGADPNFSDFVKNDSIFWEDVEGALEESQRTVLLDLGLYFSLFFSVPA